MAIRLHRHFFVHFSSVCPNCRIHAVRFTLRMDFNAEIELFQEITARAHLVIRQMETLRHRLAEIQNAQANIDQAANGDINLEADPEANAEVNAEADGQDNNSADEN